MHTTLTSRVSVAVLGLAFLLLGVSAPSANGAEPKRILFVNSFAPGTSPFAPFNSAFREHMLRAWPAQVAFYEVSLDGWRPGIKENEDALVQVMRSRFSDLRMDLVVARGMRAGQFYIRHRDELFPNVPLMVTGDEASLPSAKLRPGDSFVANTVPSVQVVTSLLKLLPDTSTIAVVFGKSAPEQYWVSRLKDEFAPLAGRVRFVWLDHLSLPEMRQRVATLEPGTVVLFGLLYVDAAGIPYLENYALSELRAASSVPIFSFYESELGLGTVGGSLLGNVESAAVAANIASRMLRGEWTNDDQVTRLDRYRAAIRLARAQALEHRRDQASAWKRGIVSSAHDVGGAQANRPGGLGSPCRTDRTHPGAPRAARPASSRRGRVVRAQRASADRARR